MTQPKRRRFAGLDPADRADLSPDRFDDLTYLNRMTTLGSVVATVVHDLNNVLQTISGSVELMQARGELSIYANDKLTRIATQASRAMAMVADLAVFARRDGGTVASVDVRRIIERAMSLRRRHLASARIAVTVEPMTGEPIMVKAGEQHLLQLLLNLLLNAEHALAGRDQPRIDVRLARHGATVRLSVADNGPGVPAEWRQWILEPFSTTRPRGQGAGLGLTVAAAVAELNGGSMMFGEGAAGGTEVVVELPAGE